MKSIMDLFAALLGKVIERFPRDLSDDDQQFYVERPGELTPAIRAGLTEHRKQMLAAEQAAEEERRVKNRVLLAQVTEPVAGMEVDCGGGWYFTIDEVVEFPVDFTPAPAELLKLGGCAPADWKHLGTAPKPGTKTVKSVICRFNQRWTEEGVSALITQTSCRFKGSGAWVREGFLKSRPSYDGKGLIAFVGDPNSRWRSVHNGDVCFPYLWYGDADRCYRDLYRVDRDWHADRRLCFLWE